MRSSHVICPAQHDTIPAYEETKKNYDANEERKKNLPKKLDNDCDKLGVYKLL